MRLGIGGLGRSELHLEFHETLQRLQEVFEGGRREHDRAAPSDRVFRDFEEATVLILFEVAAENLPFVDDLFGSDEGLIHSLSGVLVHHIYWLVAVFVGEMRASTWLGICPSNDDCGHFPRKIEDA